jgi:hypothetical protein
MEAIMVKLASGEAIGVVFLEDLEVTLSKVRRQMEEEIEELLPKEYKFVSVLGFPVSRVQEERLLLRDALEDGFIAVKPFAPICEGKSMEEGHKESPESTEESTVDPAVQGKKATKKTVKRQSTVTGYFGASSAPKKIYATAASRKGVYVFTELQINEAVSVEKDRRRFWNQTADQICREEKYNRCKADEIDKLLHEKWRLHKASIMKQEVIETKGKIEEILRSHPGLDSIVVKRKVREETVARNLNRMENAKKALDRICEEIEELYMKNGDKNEIKRKEEIHRLNNRELCKAQDALRQTLDIRKSLLKELLSAKSESFVNKTS